MDERHACVPEGPWSHCKCPMPSKVGNPLAMGHSWCNLWKDDPPLLHSHTLRAQLKDGHRSVSISSSAPYGSHLSSSLIQSNNNYRTRLWSSQHVQGVSNIYSMYNFFFFCSNRGPCKKVGWFQFKSRKWINYLHFLLCIIIWLEI